MSRAWDTAAVLGSEHDGGVAVAQDSVFTVPGNRPGEDRALDLCPKADQGRHIVSVADPVDVLLNDRAAVEIFGDVMRRSSDQLHTPLAGFRVGRRSGERGKE